MSNTGDSLSLLPYYMVAGTASPRYTRSGLVTLLLYAQERVLLHPAGDCVSVPVLIERHFRPGRLIMAASTCACRISSYAFDLRAQRLQFGLDPFISPVDLVDVVDNALS